MSSEVLSIEPAKWEGTVQGSNGACLCRAESAKNVAHALSTAVVRSPQKTLLTLARPYVAAMLACEAGIRILTSLVEFGTPRTVGAVAAALAAEQPAIWSFEAEPAAALVDAYAKLLERLVYREDGSGEAYAAMMSALTHTNMDSLFRSPFLMRAAARMMLVSGSFLAQVAASAPARDAVHASSQSAQLRPYVEECVSILLLRRGAGRASLAKGVDRLSEDANLTVSQFVWDCLERDMNDTASPRPRAGVLLLLAAHADRSVVTEMARRMGRWRTLHAEAQREGTANVIAVLLERLEDESVGCKLVAGVFKAEKDVDTRLSSAKSGSVHLLAAVGSRPVYVQKLNTKLKASQDKKVMAAQVRFRSATMPKPVATQSTIMDKIKQLRAKRSSPTGKRSRS